MLCKFSTASESIKAQQLHPHLASSHRPLSRRLDRCDRMIENKSRDPNGGIVYYVTMQITFLTRKFRNVECNLHCDIVHITTVWVSSLTLDCNGVFAINACGCLFSSGVGGPHWLQRTEYTYPKDRNQETSSDTHCQLCPGQVGHLTSNVRNQIFVL